MINFLDTTIDLSNFSCDGELQPVFDAAKFAIRVIQIAVPFALVIWGSLDWFKALIASDEKEMRVKRKPFITRVIAAIIVLVLPMLVETITRSIIGDDNTDNFWTCYVKAYPKIDFSKWQNSTSGSGSNSSSNSTNGTSNGGSNTNTNTNTNNLSDPTGCGQYSNKTECNNARNSNHVKCEWHQKNPTAGNSSVTFVCEKKANPKTCSDYIISSQYDTCGEKDGNKY